MISVKYFLSLLTIIFLNNSVRAGNSSLLLHSDYYKFLNHGYKSGQVSKEMSKLKVDVLGQLLKKHVTQLRSGERNNFGNKK